MNEVILHFQDEEWPLTYTDHDREIVRAIVFDEEGFFYFVRAERDDDFGKATLIETSGGGVEQGEELLAAIARELKEELGLHLLHQKEAVNGLCKRSTCKNGKNKRCCLIAHITLFPSTDRSLTCNADTDSRSYCGNTHCQCCS